MPDDDEVKEWIIPANLEAITTANVDESNEDMKSVDIQKSEEKSEIEPPCTGYGIFNCEVKGG